MATAPQTSELHLLDPRSAIAEAFLEVVDASKLGAGRYYDDPVGFVREAFRWQPGDAPTAYQERIMRELIRKERISVRGPHGLGKTAMHAWLVLWFSLTRDAKGIDWKVITTAGAWRQLEKYLWPEIHKWVRRLRYETVRRPVFAGNELMRLELRLTHGAAFAVACEDPARIEGAHADELLYIFDEAKTIPGETFDAAEGAFSGATGERKAYAIASSTPGEPRGRFYEIHARMPAFQNWTAIHVTLDDAIKAGRVSERWAKHDAKELWKSAPAIYANRVLGEFAESDEDGIIPHSWVEAAVERWHALGLPEALPQDELDAVGVDVGGTRDKTVAALRYGSVVTEVRVLPAGGTMQTAGEVHALLALHPKAVAIIDATGIGAGVYDRLRETGASCEPFIAGARGEGTDRSGVLRFANNRAAAWWRMREALDPERGSTVALPPEDRLIRDLVTPRWKLDSSGRVVVESKDEIRARLKRSTDFGDAVVLSFWVRPAGFSYPPAFVEPPRESPWATLGPGLIFSR
jgi:hypothetical protein